MRIAELKLMDASATQSRGPERSSEAGGAFSQLLDGASGGSRGNAAAGADRSAERGAAAGSAGDTNTKGDDAPGDRGESHEATVGVAEASGPRRQDNGGGRGGGEGEGEGKGKGKGSAAHRTDGHGKGAADGAASRESEAMNVRGRGAGAQEASEQSRAAGQSGQSREASMHASQVANEAEQADAKKQRGGGDQAEGARQERQAALGQLMRSMVGKGEQSTQQQGKPAGPALGEQVHVPSEAEAEPMPVKEGEAGRGGQRPGGAPAAAMAMRAALAEGGNAAGGNAAAQMPGGESSSAQGVGMGGSAGVSGASPANGAASSAAPTQGGMPVESEPEPEPQRIADQTLRGIRGAIQQRGGGVTLQLNPPELGSLRIRVDLQGTQVRAQIDTATEAARAALSQQLGSLRGALESHGLTVEQLQIHSQPAGNGSAASRDAGEDDDGGRSRGQHQGRSSQDQKHQRDEPEDQQRGRFAQRLLDLIG